MSTYRAAYYLNPTTGQETVMTGPEHAHLSDADLIAEAVAEAGRAQLIGPEWPYVPESNFRAALEIGQWPDDGSEHWIDTDDGWYHVYHYTEAGQPDAFEEEAKKNGPWFFEPEGYNDGDVYSQGYPTAEATVHAAKAWAVQQILEDLEQPA